MELTLKYPIVAVSDLTFHCGWLCISGSLNFWLLSGKGGFMNFGIPCCVDESIFIHICLGRNVTQSCNFIRK